MAEALQGEINAHVTPDSCYKYLCSLNSDVKKVNDFQEKNGVLHAPHKMVSEKWVSEDVRGVSTQSNTRE